MFDRQIVRIRILFPQGPRRTEPIGAIGMIQHDRRILS